MSSADTVLSFSEEQTLEALERIAKSPLLPVVSGFFFPGKPAWTLRRLIRQCSGTEDFQKNVMCAIVASVLERTSSGLSCEGLENLGGGCHLVVSNHRDITLDPAVLQWLLLSGNQASMEVCIGNNLLKGGKIVADFLLSNRMITVERGVGPRQLYASSKRLSSYIREAVVSGRNSVWIAQREGRAKDGRDLSDPAVLKMISMSGKGSFVEGFGELAVVPMSISYEYEPCDARKARELLLRRGDLPYVKRRQEDTRSIIKGLKQWKGGIHLCIGKPLNMSELEGAGAAASKSESFHRLASLLDEKIVGGYKLWKTNYMAYDLLKGGRKYASEYSEGDLAAFRAYALRSLAAVEAGLDRGALTELFWEIYANPVLAKEKWEKR